MDVVLIFYFSFSGSMKAGFAVQINTTEIMYRRRYARLANR